MIEHAQAQPFEFVIQYAALMFSRHQHWLVDRIRTRERKACDGFITIGAAKQVDPAMLERFDR